MGKMNAFYESDLFIFLLFLFLAIIFHGIGVDIVNVPLASGDANVLAFPSKIFSANFAFWNPYVMSGAPSYLNPETQSFYLPSLIIMKIFPNAFGYNLLTFLHYAFAGFFTYLFLKKLKLNRFSAFIGGLCFAFGGFLVAHEGHHAMMNAAVWLPILLYLIECYFENKEILFLFLSTIAFSGSILSGYPAVTLYTSMIVFPYIIFKIWFTDNYNSFSHIMKIKEFLKIILIIGVCGFIVGAVQILSIIESLNFINRSSITYAMFSDNSFNLMNLVTLLFPTYPYNGGNILPEILGYIGVIPLIFALLAFVLWRKKDIQIWFWSIVAIMGFLLILGNNTPLYKIMYHVPLYNMFRVPARNWFEIDFAFAVLVGFCINYLMVDKGYSLIEVKKWFKRSIIILSALTIFFLGLFYLNYGNLSLLGLLNMSPAFFLNILEKSPAIYIPLLIIIISIYFLFSIPRNGNKKLLWVFLTIFIFLDLFSYGHFFDDQYQNATFLDDKNVSEVYKFISNDETNLQGIRIYSAEYGTNEIYPNINILYGVNVVNGYYPVWLDDYCKVSSFNIYDVKNFDFVYLINNSQFLSISSTKYVVSSDPAKKKNLEFNPNYKKKFETDNGIVIYENIKYLPRARFVDKLKVIEGVNEAKDAIWNPNFDLSSTAMVEDYQNNLTLDYGEVLQTDYEKTDEVNLKVKTGNKSFLVLSDNYYQGWRAYVDGKETKIYKTNGVFKGILIEGPGEHNIKFVFKPPYTSNGLLISIISSCVIIMCILWQRLKIYNSK